MKIKIEFFKDKFIDAIGAGIYKVTVEYKNNSNLIYIGESVFVLVRCATHLYKLKNNPSYFGFNDETIENEDIVLKFELIESNSDTKERKAKENQLIKEMKPSMQSGIKDRMIQGEKIDVLARVLDNS